MLIILCDQGKLWTTHQIDSVVSAEILNRNEPLLHELIRTLMIHSPVEVTVLMGDLGSKATRWQWHRSLLNQNIYVKFIFIQCIL